MSGMRPEAKPSVCSSYRHVLCNRRRRHRETEMEMVMETKLKLLLRVLSLAGCKLMAGGQQKQHQQQQQLQQPKQTCSKCKQSQKPMASRWRCRCRCRCLFRWCCCTCCHYLSCICPGKRMATSAIYPPCQHFYSPLRIHFSATTFRYLCVLQTRIACLVPPTSCKSNKTTTRTRD